MSVYQWVEGAVPCGLEVKQVYGIVFAEDGRILLRKDGEKYSLPGGKPEPFDLNIEATLKRELDEELNVSVSRIVIAGYQLVDEENGIPAYAQVRMAAKLDRFGASRPDPDTGRTYERIFVSPKQAISLLDWGDVGRGQICSAVTIAKELLGISDVKLKNESSGGCDEKTKIYIQK
ncbi:MAG: NUDIX hydrolase [Oscillospiraceae bacterium]|nr:NUDIX hydrolase [Oscillospiraceae bacterium]